MRGQQSGYGIERAQPMQVQYVGVLALLSCYVALVLTSVFIMDWFTVRLVSGGRESIDLWAATTCESFLGCVSAPLERAGYAAYRPFAVLTLWLTAVSSAALMLRTGAYLFGLRMSRRVSTIASVLLGATALCVLALVFSAPPPSPQGASVHASPAPFVLVSAHVIGLLSIGLALREPRTPASIRDRGFPNARIVRDSR